MMSRYCVIRAVDGETGDSTNIGVIVFGEDGKQHGHRIAPMTRAIRRGDLQGDAVEWGARVEDLATSLDCLDSYNRLVDSMGHAMSCLKVGVLAGSTLSPDKLLTFVYPKMVKDE